MDRKVCILLISLLLLVYPSSGRYNLQYLAVRYSNPDNLDSEGCCDAIFCGTCDVYFEFCVRPINRYNCLQIDDTESSFASSNRHFPFSGEMYSGSVLTNPVTYSSNDPWPGSIQLVVTSRDREIFPLSPVLIDSNIFNLTLTPSTSGQSITHSSIPDIVRPGIYGIVQFTIRVLLTCQSGWTGSDCNQCTGSSCSSSTLAPVQTTTTTIATATTTTTTVTTAAFQQTTTTINQPATTTIQQTTTTTINQPATTTIQQTTTTTINQPATTTIQQTTTTVITQPTSTTDQVVGGTGATSIGGVVGGILILVIVLVLALVLGIIGFLYYRKKQTGSPNTEPPPQFFPQNPTYISPEVLDPSSTLKHSGSHYVPNQNEVAIQPQPSLYSNVAYTQPRNQQTGESLQNSTYISSNNSTLIMKHSGSHYVPNQNEITARTQVDQPRPPQYITIAHTPMDQPRPPQYTTIAHTQPNIQAANTYDRLADINEEENNYETLPSPIYTDTA